jgi:glyoxylase-like metal-dependent hydrolase (beta-lactamase superfamily II)
MIIRQRPFSISRRGFVAGLALSPFAAKASRRLVDARQATAAATKDVFRYTFGDAEVCLFDTDTWDLPVSFAASNATFEEQQAVTKEFGPLTMDVAATLVNTGNHLIVMDAGTDPGLAGRLEQEGYNAEDVDLITFSHLHYDHFLGVYGDFMRKDLVFPNARYVVSKAEHDYWMHDDGRPVSAYAEPNMPRARSEAQAFIASLGEQLELAEWEEEILPGVRMVPAIGHTGGHGAVEVTSGEETLLHVGDLILNPVLNLQHPEWYIAPAVWQEEDVASRRMLMDRAVEEHLLVQTVHFPFPGTGYVEQDGDAWRWIPLA